MVKPYLSIKLKDPQNYYLEDEVIECIAKLKLEKVLREAKLHISFKGFSSSHSNNTKHHVENIFTVEKEVQITKYNTAQHIKKMTEFEFSVQVPNGVTIPSYRYLKGSDGGKIEYMIEATLESLGGLFKRPVVQASHIIQVPLVGKINVTENGLDRTRESSIRWPKNEEGDENTCVLSAWIPHEGCIRGKDVTIRFELKQPKLYAAAESVLFELVRQEIIASGKDSLPDMTKQLDDKVIQSDRVKVELQPDISDDRLIGISQVVFMSIPSNTTPTIKENAKVMRLDYKIRVTTKIPESDSGKDKELSINIPIVVGTTGVSAIYDSGIDSIMSPQFNNQDIHSDTSSSIANSGYGSVHSKFYPPGPIQPPPLQPPMAGPGGFHMMPDPSYFYPPPQQQMYPPNRFYLNPQNSPYISIDPNEKIEGMPVPDFHSNVPYPPNQNHSNEAISQNGSSFTFDNNDRMSSQVYPPYPPNNGFGNFNMSSPVSMYPPSQGNDYNSTPKSPCDLNEQQTQKPNDLEDELTSAINELSPTNSVSRPTRQELKPFSESTTSFKPNTPTPPQTPGISTMATEIQQQTTHHRRSNYAPKSLASYTELDDSNEESCTAATRSVTVKSSNMATRIDPLDALARSIYPPEPKV